MNEKGFAIPITFILALLLVIGFVVFKQGYFPLQTILPVARPVSSPLPNWKTYTDSAGQYSYKYPADLFVKVKQPSGVQYFYPTQQLADRGDGSGAVFYIQVLVDSRPIPTDGKYVDTQGRQWSTTGPVWGQADSSNYEAVTNYKERYYAVGSQAFGRNLGLYTNKELIIQKGNSFDASPLLEEHSKLIQQILSTFEFTPS